MKLHFFRILGVKTLLFYPLLTGFLLFGLSTLHAAEAEQKDPQEKESINTTVKNKSDAVKKGRSTHQKISEEEARDLLQNKRPNAEIMELALNFDHEKFFYEGLMFEDSHNKDHHGTARTETKKKYEFVINAHTGRFERWKAFEYHFSLAMEQNQPSKMLTKEEAKKLVLERVPNATVVSLDWNMKTDLIYYDGGMYKDGIYYHFILDAYTGKVVTWNQEGARKESLAETMARKSEQEKARIRYVALEKVRRFLLSKVPGAYITDLDLNTAMERPFFYGKMVHNRNAYEFKIDAYTGEILQWNHRVIHAPYYGVSSHSATPSIPIPPTTPIVSIPQRPIPPSPPIPPRPNF